MKADKILFFSGILIFATAILFFIHNWIVGDILKSYVYYYSVWKIYVFHFFVTFLILTALYFVSKKAPNNIGFAFLGFILLKMVAAVVFLVPLIKLESGSKIPDFISFFIPYFIYLFIEIVLTLRLIRQSAP